MQHKNLAPQDSHSPSQEQVENSTGSQIPALKCVVYTGIGSLYPTISVANATDDVRGITQSIIQDGSRGYILVYGTMYNVDTSAWAPGTSLFADASGNLTDVSGGGPQVANVLKQHATTGVIQVTCLDTPAAGTVLVQDTDSIDLDTLGNLVTADLNLSANPASTDNLKATTTIKSGPSKGLHVEYPFADTDTDGVLRSTDWNTFNNKVDQNDPRFSIQNRLIVKQNPGTGEFATIASAIAAVTAPSAGNRWHILVGPGIYVEPQLNIPQFVSIYGTSRSSVVVEPDAPNHHVFSMSQQSTIAFMTIRNAGVGYAGIYAANCFSTALVHDVTFSTCDTALLIETTLGGVATTVSGSLLSFINSVNKDIHIRNNSQPNTVQGSFNDCTIISTSASATDSVLLDGNTVSYRFNGIHVVRAGTQIANGVRITNGATIEMFATEISGWNTCINIDNVGTNPSAIFSGVNLANCANGLVVSNTTAFGHFDGYVPYADVDIHPDSQFFVVNKDANIITVAKRGGDFASVKDAMDSIADASATKRYVISVGPGIFTEDQIVFKEFVVLVGQDDTATVIEANDPSVPLIVGHSNSELKQVQLRGPTDPNVPLIYYSGVAATAATFGVIECAFENADLVYHVEGNTTYPTVIRTEGCRVTTGAPADKIALIDGSAAAPVFCFIDSFNYRKVSAPYPTHVFDVMGSNAQLVISNNLVETNSNVSHGVHVQDGAKLDIISSAFSGFDTALHIHNIGSASTVQASNLVIRNCTTDINAEHPGTMGSISALADSSKVIVDAAAPLSITLTSDLSDGGLLASGPLKIGRKFSYAENVLDLLEGEPSMGVMSGGALTDGGGFTVNVAAGFGYAMVQGFPDHRIRRVEWNNSSINLAANQDRYIFFNSSGVLSSAASVSDSAFIVLLGRVVTNGTGIELIDASPLHTHHPLNHMDRLFRDALGPIYDSGSIVTENATPFKLDVTAGVYFFSVNRFTPVGGSAIDFTEYYRDGLGGFNSAIIDLVNNTHYDDGTGTLAPLTVGYYTKHTLYVNCDGAAEKYFLVLGQAEYAALAAVEDAPLPTVPSWLRDAVSPVAAVIIQEGSANIIEVIDLRPRIGFRSSGVSASSDHGNLLGLADDDHPQYLLADGSRPMSDDLDMGGNDVINVGLVDGVDVSAHAVRHLPNGADPITTAAPLTAVGGNTANGVGTANSLARSDHQHSVATGTPSTITPDEANAPGVSNNLARADHIHNIPTDVAVGLDANSTNTEGVGTSFARNDHTHDLATGPVSSQTPDQVNAEGTSANLARADHVHNVPTAAPVTANADGNNNQGVAATFSRADHKHNVATGTPVSQTPDQGNAEGVSPNLARADHVHNIPAEAPTTTLSPATTNAEGAAASFARSNHTHAIATGLLADVQSIEPDDAASAGTADRFARADHQHAIVTDAPTTNLSPATTNTEGVGTSFARNDHTHAIETGLVGDVTAIQPDATAAAGTANRFARADHRHAIDAAAPVNTGSANSEGVSTSFARADHVHNTTIARNSTGSTVDTTTTSLTDVPLDSMSLTPAAGTYFVNYSVSASNTNNGRYMFYSIYVGGVKNAQSERRVGYAGGIGGSAAASAFVTVNGSQAIEVQWRTTGNTGTTHERTLTIMRIGD